MEWIIANSAELIAAFWALVAFLDIVVRLTPTEKDDNVLAKVANVIGLLIPNRSKAGGVHTPNLFFRKKNK